MTGEMPDLQILTGKKPGMVLYKSELLKMEHYMPVEEHKKMLNDLRIYTQGELFERFDDVCDYFIAKDQYVEFEIIN